MYVVHIVLCYMYHVHKIAYKLVNYHQGMYYKRVNYHSS